MQNRLHEILFEWALLPDGDPRKKELEFEIQWHYPGARWPLVGHRIERNIGRAIGTIFSLAGFGKLIPKLIPKLACRREN